MFCYQCEQTAKGQGCTKIGVCGKEPDIAALQDLLIKSLKTLSEAVVTGRQWHIKPSPELQAFVLEALFSTLTNVNFDANRFVAFNKRSAKFREEMEKAILSAGDKSYGNGTITITAKATLSELVAEGSRFGIKDNPLLEPDLVSLRELLIYGLKGVAAYANHARILGKEDEGIYNFIFEALCATERKDIGVGELLTLVLRCGEINLKAMELLDTGNTSAYGNPVITSVPLGAKKGKAILVSGHDLKDLAELLKQTAGKGITIYTHGEMLPTHAYPELKKYSHFYGHYGTAWQNQQKEFAHFPGAILMTTNCLQKPEESYRDNIFTCGCVGFPNIPHIVENDFSAVIKRANELPGFSEDTDAGTVLTGFGHNTVLSIAGTIIDMVKSGQIKHFFLVGGCDGAKSSRNYFSEFVEKTPPDTIILTLGCGKFKFFDKNLGKIGEIPRLLDVGQCNDSYSAIRIALALSQAFGVGVNELPLSLIISWYEQKAVAVLLTLLHLGIKNIRLGPSLPAFITPNILNVLVENFAIQPITSAEKDLNDILATK
ncbi:MAG: hydroxylamine reductase [Deltaproteobacteria bacterium]|nr:hydroxylamine reductase [Deltaproteobacteria bacterium]